MLCSISTPTSNSSWLDRLRSSKGFPISPDLESLDQFLSSNTNPKPNPNPIPKPPPNPPFDNDRNLFDLMSTVLSDLFVVGSSSPNPPNPQKSCRKQPNPRNCNGGEPLVGGNREVSPSSVNNSAAAAAVGGRKRKRKLKVRKRRGSEGLAKDSDLSGFSRTEVTVIDTSLSPDWKAARVLYRKGLVRKVREEKAVRVGRKKRRRVGLAEKPGGENERKGNNAGMRREQLALLDKGCIQTDKVEDSEETDDQILVPRRQKFSRSPQVPPTKNSSILHLKIIGEKNRGTCPRHIFKRK